MIERINAMLDVYSQMRGDFALRDGTRGSSAKREKNVTPQAVAPEMAESDPELGRQVLQLEVDADESKIVRFQQSSIEGDGADGYDQAEEMQPALEASVLPADPQMAAVVNLYRRNGRALATRGETVGTRLNAYA